jgi:hypothetical protein
MYGYIDLAAPERVYTARSGGSTLGQVWRQIRGMGNCGIVRLADNRLIWRRVSNHPGEYLSGGVKPPAFFPQSASPPLGGLPQSQAGGKEG